MAGTSETVSTAAVLRRAERGRGIRRQQLVAEAEDGLCDASSPITTKSSVGSPVGSRRGLSPKKEREKSNVSTTDAANGGLSCSSSASSLPPFNKSSLHPPTSPSVNGPTVVTASGSIDIEEDLLAPATRSNFARRTVTDVRRLLDTAASEFAHHDTFVAAELRRCEQALRDEQTKRLALLGDVERLEARLADMKATATQTTMQLENAKARRTQLSSELQQARKQISNLYAELEQVRRQKSVTPAVELADDRKIAALTAEIAALKTALTDEQTTKARQIADLEQQLRERELRATTEQADLTTQIHSLRGSIATAEAEAQFLKSERARLERALQSAETQLQQREALVTKLQAQQRESEDVTRLREDLASKLAQIDDLNEELSIVHAHNKRLQNELNIERNSQNNDVTDLTRQVQSLENALRNEEARNHEMQDQLLQLSAVAVRVSEAASENRRLKETLASDAAEKTQLRNTLAEAQSVLKVQENTIQRLREQCTQLMKDCSSQQILKDAMADRLASLEQKSLDARPIEQLRAENELLWSRLDDAKQGILSSGESVSEAARELIQLRLRLKELAPYLDLSSDDADLITAAREALQRLHSAWEANESLRREIESLQNQLQEAQVQLKEVSTNIAARQSSDDGNGTEVSDEHADVGNTSSVKDAAHTEQSPDQVQQIADQVHQLEEQDRLIKDLERTVKLLQRERDVAVAAAKGAQTQIAALERIRAEREAAVEEALRKAQHLESELEGAKKFLRLAEGELQHIKTGSDRSEDGTANSDLLLADLEQKTRDLEKQAEDVERVSADLKEAKAQLALLQSERDELRQHEDALKEKVAELEKQMESATQAEARVAEAETALEELQSRLAELQIEKQCLQVEVDAARTTKEVIDETTPRSEAAATSDNSQWRNDLEAVKEAAEEQKKAFESTVADLEQQVADLERQVTELQDQVRAIDEEKDEKLAAMKAKYHEKTATLEKTLAERDATIAKFKEQVRELAGLQKQAQDLKAESEDLKTLKGGVEAKLAAQATYLREELTSLRNVVMQGRITVNNLPPLQRNIAQRINKLLDAPNLLSDPPLSRVLAADQVPSLPVLKREIERLETVAQAKHEYAVTLEQSLESSKAKINKLEAAWKDETRFYDEHKARLEEDLAAAMLERQKLKRVNDTLTNKLHAAQAAASGEKKPRENNPELPKLRTELQQVRQEREQMLRKMQELEKQRERALKDLEEAQAILTARSQAAPSSDVIDHSSDPWSDLMRAEFVIGAAGFLGGLTCAGYAGYGIRTCLLLLSLVVTGILQMLGYLPPLSKANVTKVLVLSPLRVIARLAIILDFCKRVFERVSRPVRAIKGHLVVLTPCRRRAVVSSGKTPHHHPKTSRTKG